MCTAGVPVTGAGIIVIADSGPGDQHVGSAGRRADVNCGDRPAMGGPGARLPPEAVTRLPIVHRLVMIFLSSLPSVVKGYVPAWLS
jgi:hypothetical protein